MTEASCDGEVAAVASARGECSCRSRRDISARPRSPTLAVESPDPKERRSGEEDLAEEERSRWLPLLSESESESES